MRSLATVALPTLAHAELRSTARIETCLERGDTSDGCEDHLVVVLSFDHAVFSTSPETITVDTLVSEDAPDEELTLTKPFEIKWLKTQSKWLYERTLVEEIRGEIHEAVSVVESCPTAVGWANCVCPKMMKMNKSFACKEARAT